MTEYWIKYHSDYIDGPFYNADHAAEQLKIAQANYHADCRLERVVPPEPRWDAPGTAAWCETYSDNH